MVSVIACGGSSAPSQPTPAAETVPPAETPAAVVEPAPADVEPAPESTAGPTGKATSTVQGCAGMATATKAAPKHAETPESLTVKADGQVIVATHTLGPACCLKGEVTTEADGASVVIHEKLAGKPCRCRCGSTIETRQPVSAGSYDVRVVVEEPGNTSRDAGSNRVTVE